MDALDEKMARSMEIINQMISEHNPSHIFGMFSGGHDSLCATHFVSQHPKFTRAVHMNTTIGIEQTRQFVRDVSQGYGWDLLEYIAPVSYREIVLKHGFPGPGGHTHMYRRLKERNVRRLVREHKRGFKDRIALITGVRTSESVRRMGNVVDIDRQGAIVWTAPILHWNDDDKTEYIRRYNLPQNPVVKTLCMSGECLCGAFARPEEFSEIQAAYPETAAMISQLQDDAKAAGVPAVWGKRPDRKNSAAPKTLNSRGLCVSCDAKQWNLFDEQAALNIPEVK